jgi:phosphate starvation-inducible membrane PsiE
MNKNREKALEGLTRIAQVIVSDKYHDESNEVLMFAKAIILQIQPNLQCK